MVEKIFTTTPPQKKLIQGRFFWPRENNSDLCVVALELNLIVIQNLRDFYERRDLDGVQTDQFQSRTILEKQTLLVRGENSVRRKPKTVKRCPLDSS